MDRIWAGIDIGKEHHHCVVIDCDGKRLLSRRVANDETELLALVADVSALGNEVTWTVDVVDGGAALMLAILLGHDQGVLYLSGRAVHRAAAGYRGEGKSDARDAAIIADQARMRRDLTPIRPGDEITVELKMLTARRADLVADRTRAVNRLREQLLGLFPALERSFDYIHCKGALTLLTGYQTPAAIRRSGLTRLERWLATRKTRNAHTLARRAVEAAASQRTTLPGETVAAQMVQTLATEVLALHDKIAEIDKLIESRFQQHPNAAIIQSLPGFGPLLGAEFLAITGGDMTCFGTPDRLAGMAGLAPVPRDSGRVSGNLHRPKRYHRGLQRVFYYSAMNSIRWSDESQRFYARKRAEGKRHTHAVLALARRRVNVLWAMLRDQRPYQAAPVTT
ncbi:IS110 family RNA-guided transposase [Pseudonocardia bannensis]|uniref:IS110 family transposase n=1 Tax=Pseudonocardia bannensis TaxID=630973 RepID=A0A848DS66_9PSEU|nr:IS110 family transposase [Pseudonocardia bannensis]NMH95702.1 IS110 family transposase [Pseudonocardia bannensis]